VPSVSVQISMEPAANETQEVIRPQGGEPGVSERGQEQTAEAQRQDVGAQGERTSAEPPSAEETIRGLRQDRTARREARSAEFIVGVQRQESDASARPTFTPYTVAPSIINREQVVQAMVREYPALLRDAGIGGTIRVYFFIDEDGVVRDTRIDQSSGHPALDAAALSVAGVYRFRPALNRDKPTPVWVSFPITFQVR
jgi:TonB family protein